MFASLLNGYQFLKERFCSPGSKFFPLSIDPLLEGLSIQRNKQEVVEVVPLSENGGKTWQCTLTPHLRTGMYVLVQLVELRLLHENSIDPHLTEYPFFNF